MPNNMEFADELELSKIKIEKFDTISVVSALLLGATISLMMELPDHQIVNKIFTSPFTIFGSLSIVAHFLVVLISTKIRFQCSILLGKSLFGEQNISSKIPTQWWINNFHKFIRSANIQCILHIIQNVYQIGTIFSVICFLFFIMSIYSVEHYIILLVLLCLGTIAYITIHCTVNVEIRRTKRWWDAMITRLDGIQNIN